MRRVPAKIAFFFLLVTIFIERVNAQFVVRFDRGTLALDEKADHGWAYYTGAGNVSMTFFSERKGHASILVDATHDERGVWWALIRHRVSATMNLDLLRDSRFALRVEARIRVSEAPRRVNLHLNTQRTKDFHSHLMEYDIADTTEWHTISMTTHGFDAANGDTVYGQLALMDWGLQKYRVDIEYFKVDVVRHDTVGPDLGDPIPYRPPIPASSAFNTHLPVIGDCTMDQEYPSRNFNDWSVENDTSGTTLLSAGSRQFIVLRWDPRLLTQRQVKGSGVLELITYALEQKSGREQDFGLMRIVEVIGGTPFWKEETVTLDNLSQGAPLSRVLNSQMIVDINVAKERGEKNFAVIPEVVLKRLVAGRTLGLALLPLGAIHASFYARENAQGAFAPLLHLNLE